MSIKERIYSFINYKGISVKKFEERCEMSNGYIASMRKGLGLAKLNNVLSAYPELNREWLLYGEGEMLRSGTAPSVKENFSIPDLISQLKEQAEEIGRLKERIATLERQKGKDAPSVQTSTTATAV